MYNRRHHYWLWALVIAVILGIGYHVHNKMQDTASPEQTATSRVATSPQLASHLAGLNYTPGTEPYVNVNHGKSTLPRKWTHDHVDYSPLDHENRTAQGSIAWIDRQNVAHDSLRTQQIVKPTGYHNKKIGPNDYLVNRGHEIAYSLSKGIDKQGKYNPRQQSGDQNNMRNLFTQTAFCNQEVQTVFENKVRQALYQGKHVIYQVKPIFQGHDLMAKGVQMQAISTDGKLNFNVYLFNVQPGYKFNYANGTSSVDHAMKCKTPAGAPHFHDNGGNSRQSDYRDDRWNRGRRHHHFWRDYMIYRGVKGAYRAHKRNKWYKRYGRRPYERRSWPRSNYGRRRSW